MSTWHIQAVIGEADRYEFFNIRMIEPAGDISIHPANGEPIPIPGPLSHQRSFEADLAPGDYTIHWHFLRPHPDHEQTLEFTVPLADGHKRMKLPEPQ